MSFIYKPHRDQTERCRRNLQTEWILHQSQRLTVKQCDALILTAAELFLTQISLVAENLDYPTTSNSSRYRVDHFVSAPDKFHKSFVIHPM